jgi:hypothetical protein
MWTFNTYKGRAYRGQLYVTHSLAVLKGLSMGIDAKWSTICNKQTLLYRLCTKKLGQILIPPPHTDTQIIIRIRIITTTN